MKQFLRKQRPDLYMKIGQTETNDNHVITATGQSPALNHMTLT